MSHPEPSCVDFRLLASDLSAGCLWRSSAPTPARVHRSFRSRRSGENGKGPEIDCRGIWRRYFISCDKTRHRVVVPRDCRGNGRLQPLAREHDRPPRDSCTPDAKRFPPTGGPGGGRPSRVRLQLAPPATAPPDLKQRWMRLGLSAEALLVNRPSAPSGPQAIGPGHERVSIHRRQGVRRATPNQTYAYALSLQSKRQGQYLERYLAGDRNRVWAEFLELGETIRRETLLADATAVARETMRRCRTNIERLSERLLAVGYEFKNPDQALVSPSEKVLE